MSTPDLYQVLGVPRDATPEAIDGAFKALAYLHPDRHPHDPTARARFAQISEAHATLSDPTARARYNLVGASSEGASAPVSETVELIGEIAKGAKGIDPAKAGLRLADKLATPEGRREIGGFAKSLWSLLR